MKKILELMKKYQEIISYLFWGGATTVVSWGSYGFFNKGLSLSITVSNILSWVCAVLFAYVTNKLFVFQSKSWKWEVVGKEFGLFVSSRLLTGAFEIIMVPFCVYLGMNQALFGVEGAVSKIFVSIIVVILNYICSKLFVFKKKKTKED